MTEDLWLITYGAVIATLTGVVGNYFAGLVNTHFENKRRKTEKLEEKRERVLAILGRTDSVRDKISLTHGITGFPVPTNTNDPNWFKVDSEPKKKVKTGDLDDDLDYMIGLLDDLTQDMKGMSDTYFGLARELVRARAAKELDLAQQEEE